MCFVVPKQTKREPVLVIKKQDSVGQWCLHNENFTKLGDELQKLIADGTQIVRNAEELKTPSGFFDSHIHKVVFQPNVPDEYIEEGLKMTQLPLKIDGMTLKKWHHKTTDTKTPRNHLCRCRTCEEEKMRWRTTKDGMRMDCARRQG